MNESKKIPMWKKIAYGCGAGGGNVLSTLLASFLLSITQTQERSDCGNQSRL